MELWCSLWSVLEKKQLSKQRRRRWFETLSRSLWPHCNILLRPWYLYICTNGTDTKIIDMCTMTELRSSWSRAIISRWLEPVTLSEHCCLWFKQMFLEHSPTLHDDVIKWKHFPRYWPCVRGIHRSPVNSPHKGQWRGALIFSLICARISGWVNNREAGDLRRQQAHCDVIVMECSH